MLDSIIHNSDTFTKGERLMRGDSESLANIVTNFRADYINNLEVRPVLANNKLNETIGGWKSGVNVSSFEDILSEWREEGLDRVGFLPKERILSDQEKIYLKSALISAVDTSEFTTGDSVSDFESAISSYLDMSDTIATTSGTDAMKIALLALGVTHGDEVILPANSFSATENAVLATGARPIFCDIRKDGYNMDPDKIERLTTSKTRAIIPVHLYGKAANTSAIKEIADRRGLKVIEDACQAIGMTGLGRHSHCAILSFNPVKNFGICGKGGAVVTNDPDLVYRCRSLSYHGFIPGKKNVKVESFGFNSRLDNILACGALAILPYLSLNNLKRSILAKRYIDKLKPLERCGKIILPSFEPDNVWHLFPVQIIEGSTQSFRASLNEHHIDTDVYYPVLSHMQQTPFARQIKNSSQLEITELYHSRLVNLPLYQNFTIQEQDLVVDAIYRVLD